jgi:hypothetical protein
MQELFYNLALINWDIEWSWYSIISFGMEGMRMIAETTLSRR